MTGAKPTNNVVLIVDDAPETLQFLCDALAHEGYTVLVARDGIEARARMELAMPDAVLLDAVMPGPSGFDVCRWIKQDPTRAHVPVIFMTGLSDTPHIVEGFAAGGVDYVVKPVRIAEVLARLATHVRNARVSRLAREATDIAGKGVVLLDGQGRIAWQSPVAQRALAGWGETDPGARLQAACEAGLGRIAIDDEQELTLRVLGSAGLNETMLLLEASARSRGTSRSDPAAQSRLADAALTRRETEVLSWLAKGKTNRDIADILGMSPRTVNKHLEHVFEKLGVETRAAAAALASRVMGED
ncbi:DNA-binding response regulator [Pelomonas cellulosilytica]|uniref:DNA-binding response regulator n=1 Tax=Pelomonas cellulosilytica TaxID=2906762 RepID=A0ABS8XRQ7_9BURK|nr:DNA-binding response regulator [Pelomonas sp. P8]MCE4554543.1 DNA-binding response regulator [Pelomonas sp. P8]